MVTVHIRARAGRDLLSTADYLEDEGGLALADRFLSAAQTTFEKLAQMPFVGVPCGFTKASTKRLRRWPVEGFENWLIFYLPKRVGIEVVHVVHGARNIDDLLN